MLGLGRGVERDEIIDFYHAFAILIDTTLDSDLVFTVQFFTDPLDLTVITWGDGNITLVEGTDNVESHTYASGGQYVVTVDNIVNRYHSIAFTKNDKIIDVLQWGTFTGTGVRFCTNLNDSLSAIDEPDWSQFPVYNLAHGIFRGSIFVDGVSHWFQETSNNNVAQRMFQGNTSYNEDLSGWDTSGFTSMASMFNGCSSFDQSLASWNISSCTTMSQMIQNSGMSTANYDATLIGWAAQAPNIQSDVVFTLGPKYTSAAQSARDLLTGTYNWTISDGGLQT